jgi:hypothetical protein
MEQKRNYVVRKALSAGNQTYRKWSDYSEGDVVVGTFVGIHTCQYDKENFKVKVLDAQFADGTGDSFIGKTLVLNNVAFLNTAMEKVTEGEVVQVEYTGTTPISKGKYAGKDCHTGSVAVVEIEAEESNGL